jgi:hypothetical protein
VLDVCMVFYCLCILAVNFSGLFGAVVVFYVYYVYVLTSHARIYDGRQQYCSNFILVIANLMAS